MSARVKEIESENENISSGRHAVQSGTSYIKYILVAVYIFAGLCAILYFNSQVTQYAAANSRIKKEIEELESQNKSLSAKLEQKYNLSYVEDYAKNVLGMVKLDKNDVNFVELSDHARMTLAAPEENTSEVLAGISRSFNIMLEYLN